MDNVLFSSNNFEWSTPDSLFIYLDNFYHFTIDLAASSSNNKCARFYSLSDSAFNHSWDGETAFLNPPYGKDIFNWVSKSLHSKADIVLLVPSRTDTKWFHLLYDDPDTSLKFIKGRLRFGNSKFPAPFPSLIAFIHKLYLFEVDHE